MNTNTLLKGIVRRAILRLIEPDIYYAHRAQTDFQGRDDITEIVFPYGISAVPHEGTMALMLNVQADPGNRISLPYTGKNRIKDEVAGTVFVHSPIGVSKITLLASGEVKVFGTTVTVEATTVNIEAGNVNIGTGASVSGLAIARVGDSVQTNPATGTGTITSGSPNHKAT